MAAELASLRISKEAMSLVFISFNLPVNIIPSNTINGKLPAVIVFLPRIRTSGVPPALVTGPIFKPDVVPLKDSNKFTLVTFAIGESSRSMLATAPVRSRFFVVPYPMTTISSKVLAPSTKITFISVLPLISTS